MRILTKELPTGFRLRSIRDLKFPTTGLVYQPQLELLTYLRVNGFKTFIVSGGGAEFMRVFAEKVYGIPPEQVVGSSGEVKFVTHSGRQAGIDKRSED